MDYLQEVLLDSVIDSLRLLPLLFLVYLLIEFLEYKQVFKFEKSKLLKGRASPVMGALFGSVPQCGFSIISTDLYAERKISVGALIAVYIATSDEALPIMLSQPKAIPALVVLILVKIVFAILVGYLSMFLYDKVFFKNQKLATATVTTQPTIANQEIDSQKEQEKATDSTHEKGCCHHDVKPTKFEWMHPIVHSLKILLFIFIVNLIFGTIVYFVGEDNLASFLSSSYVWQPLFSVLIGLIPNCASSVILTELYLSGGLSFGAIVAGLSVNAGLGLVFLFKQNKNIKEIIFIICMLVIPSLILGYALHYIPIDLLSIV